VHGVSRGETDTTNELPMPWRVSVALTVRATQPSCDPHSVSRRARHATPKWPPHNAENVVLCETRTEQALHSIPTQWVSGRERRGEWPPPNAEIVIRVETRTEKALHRIPTQWVSRRERHDEWPPRNAEKRPCTRYPSNGCRDANAAGSGHPTTNGIRVETRTEKALHSIPTQCASRRERNGERPPTLSPLNPKP
jgi:hypothetical protein